MSSPRQSGSSVQALHRVLRRWRRDQQGTTAVEFAIVGVPFLMMCFGVITVGLHFLTTYSLENAVERAGRLIRTGQAQTSMMSADQFKQQVCVNAASYIDCTSKLKVHVQSWADFGSITPKACLDASGNMAGSGNGGDPVGNSSGGASRVVLITACYEWELAARLPFLRLGKMNNGSALIQAATTFRTEPYN